MRWMRASRAASYARSIGCTRDLFNFGVNDIYFLSPPMMQILVPFEPLDVGALRSRRRSVAQFLGNALFVDRGHGSSWRRACLRRCRCLRGRIHWCGEKAYDPRNKIFVTLVCCSSSRLAGTSFRRTAREICS